MHFLEWKCLNLIKITLKFVAEVPIHNIPALDRRQAIIWTNDGLSYQHIYVSLSLNKLIALFYLSSHITQFYSQ